MKLEIISLDKSIFSGEVSQVTVPGSKGSFQILPNHAPLISTLTSGKVAYVQDDVTHELAITKGVLSVANNNIMILDRS